MKKIILPLLLILIGHNFTTQADNIYALTCGSGRYIKDLVNINNDGTLNSSLDDELDRYLNNNNSSFFGNINNNHLILHAESPYYSGWMIPVEAYIANDQGTPKIFIKDYNSNTQSYSDSKTKTYEKVFITNSEATTNKWSKYNYTTYDNCDSITKYCDTKKGPLYLKIRQNSTGSDAGGSAQSSDGTIDFDLTGKHGYGIYYDTDLYLQVYMSS